MLLLLISLTKKGNLRRDYMSRTILLVDDQKFIRRIYTSDLKSRGYSVIEAVDGEEALNFLIKNRVDLVLLDLSMPKMNGFEVCRTIRKEGLNKNVPVIFLTANADKKSVVLAVQAGANDYFVKNPDTDALMIKVAKLIERIENK